MRPVFAFFCPVPALLLVCRQCEPCGCSSRNGTGHHSAESLTGSTRQPSWRVMHGSVRHPVGQRFHSDDTVAGVRSIFPLTRGQVIRSPRCRALSGGTALALQLYSHILYRLFYPNSADHFQGATHQFQLLSTDFTQIIQLTATPGQQLSSDSRRCISRGRCAGNGRRWRDCRNWRGTCGSSSHPL